VAIDPNSLPRDAETLRKIVVDLAAQLDRSLAEQNKYQSSLRGLLAAQRNRKSEQLSKGQLALDRHGIPATRTVDFDRFAIGHAHTGGWAANRRDRFDPVGQSWPTDAVFTRPRPDSNLAGFGCTPRIEK